MKWDDEKRQTGRTTRMIQEAITQAKNGRAVYILAANLSHKEALIHMIREMTPEFPNHGIKVETRTSLGYIPDPARPVMLGAHPNCLLLIDHHYIEVYYGALLDAWVKYDLPTNTKA